MLCDSLLLLVQLESKTKERDVEEGFNFTQDLPFPNSEDKEESTILSYCTQVSTIAGQYEALDRPRLFFFFSFGT